MRKLLRWVLPLIFGILIFIFIGYPANITGTSMAPNLNDKSLVIVFKLSEIQKGDIVAFKHDGKMVVKRVVAIKDDKVTIKDGNLYINNRIDNYSPKEVFEQNSDYSQDYIVTEDYYVVGDNRKGMDSYDSRFYGPISKQDILGKVIIIYNNTHGKMTEDIQDEEIVFIEKNFESFEEWYEYNEKCYIEKIKGMDLYDFKYVPIDKIYKELGYNNFFDIENNEITIKKGKFDIKVLLNDKRIHIKKDSKLIYNVGVSGSQNSDIFLDNGNVILPLTHVMYIINETAMTEKENKQASDSMLHEAEQYFKYKYFEKKLEDLKLRLN